MKKFSWILALLAALAVVFVGVGCGGDGPEGGDEFERTEALDFDLAAAIDDAEIATGPFATSAAAKTALNPIGIELAGDPKIAVTAAGGLTVDTDAQDWGAGIDLMNSVFNFQKGDVITVKGKLLEKGDAAKFEGIYVSVTPGKGESEKGKTGFDAKGFVTLDASDAFAVTLTLTDAQVASIRGADPTAIRIGAKPKGVVFEITELTAVGEATATPPAVDTGVAGIRVFGEGFTYNSTTGIITLDAGTTDKSGVVAIPVPAALQTSGKIKVKLSDVTVTAATAKVIVKVLADEKAITDVADGNWYQGTILADPSTAQYKDIANGDVAIDLAGATDKSYVFLQHNNNENKTAKYSFKVISVTAGE